MACSPTHILSSLLFRIQHLIFSLSLSLHATAIVGWRRGQIAGEWCYTQSYYLSIYYVFAILLYIGIIIILWCMNPKTLLHRTKTNGKKYIRCEMVTARCKGKKRVFCRRISYTHSHIEPHSMCYIHTHIYTRMYIYYYVWAHIRNLFVCL